MEAEVAEVAEVAEDAEIAADAEVAKDAEVAEVAGEELIGYWVDFSRPMKTRCSAKLSGQIKQFATPN